MKKIMYGLVAVIALSALTGCQESLDPADDPAAVSTPADPMSPTGQPSAGATDPASALPDRAGAYVRDHAAEQRNAAKLLELQNDPPGDGPKYSLGPLMGGIYNVDGDMAPAGELWVLRADGRFPDTGAAMTDFTAKIRAQGSELTPIDSGEYGGSAGCTIRAAQGASVTACYVVDSTTLLLVLGTKSIEEVAEGVRQLHPALHIQP